MKVGRRAVAVAAIVLILSGRLTGHDIPADVTVHAFLKPEGQVLRFLVRVPLRAMMDVEFPKRGPGYLDLSRVDSSLEDAATLWISDKVTLYEDGVALREVRVAETRVSLPSDSAFGSFDTALAHVTGPRLPVETEIFWDQGMLDVLFEYPIRSAGSRFAMVPGLERLGLTVTTVLRFLPGDGSIRAFQFHGNPGLVQLDPRWHQAAWLFVKDGFFHILDGTDHLLFLLCLVVPFRRLRPLAAVVTAFTVAHSITLIASAYDLAPSALWFPPLVELLIAVSIVYMALENIVGSNVQRRWMITFGFGLVHGFGFSFALRDSLQFAGDHLLTSLLSFNIGVELGQLLVLILAIPLLDLTFKRVVAERVGTIILSAFVAHTAWHWTTERYGVLSQFAWPELSTLALVSVMRWSIVIVLLGGSIWFISQWRAKPEKSRTSSMKGENA